MRYGVWEDEHSFKNSVVGNSINFFEAAALRSEGRDSLVRDNVEHAGRPYNDTQPSAGAQRKVQSFERELTARFIALQIQRGAP